MNNPSPTIVAFDTSMDACSVAVLHDGKIKTAQRIDQPHQQTRLLIPMIEAALGDTGLSYADIDAIAVTTGPGSFTGIRIALAAAKGYNLAMGIPLIGVTTLEAMAYEAQYQQPATNLAVIMHAGRGQYYLQLFHGDSAEVSNAAPLLLPADAVVAQLPDTRFLALGNAAMLAQDTPHATILEVTRPHAQYIALLAAARFATKSAILSPLYIRPPDAKLPAQSA